MVELAFFDCVNGNSVIGNTVENFLFLDCLSGKLGFKKFTVIKTKDGLIQKNPNSNYTWKKGFLDLVKMICYLSVIIPISFLILKGIYRYRCSFTIITPPAVTDISLTDAECDRISTVLSLSQKERNAFEINFEDKINRQRILPSPDSHRPPFNEEHFRARQSDFSKNIDALSLLMKKPVKEDVLCFSIGFSGRADQLWPRPVKDEIFRNKSVLNLLFEYEHNYSGEDIYHDLNYSIPNRQKDFILSHLPKVEVAQFACGFPNSDQARKPPLPGWPSKEKVREFHQDFTDQIENCLVQGKNVYLGYYTGVTPPFFLDLYNRLKPFYKDQIYFLFSHGNLSMVPLSTLTEQQFLDASRNRDESTRKKYLGIINFFPNMHEANV